MVDLYTRLLELKESLRKQVKKDSGIGFNKFLDRVSEMNSTEM